MNHVKTMRAAPAQMEPLENRTLLSASMTAAAVTATPTSTTVLKVKPTTADFGQDVIVTVTVKGTHGKPTGPVELLDNGSLVLASGQPLMLTLKGGKAKYDFGPGDIALDTTGPHALAAHYLGNGVLPDSLSASSTVTITAPPFTTTADGLRIATVKKGSGSKAVVGKTARVLYTGIFASDLTIFDYATANHGAGSKPYLEFVVGANQVIPGFDEGTAGMKVGEQRVVFIPSAQGYGSNPPAGSGIPADADLVFLIKLLKVGKPTSA